MVRLLQERSELPAWWAPAGTVITDHWGSDGVSMVSHGQTIHGRCMIVWAHQWAEKYRPTTTPLNSSGSTEES